MNVDTVKIPDLESMVEAVRLQETKQGMFDIVQDWLELAGGQVTLSQLATVDDYYTTLPSQSEWRNVRNNKAGFLPMRKAALALAKLIHKEA